MTACVENRIMKARTDNQVIENSNRHGAKYQGCHWSGKNQGNSRLGKSQGILELVREIWNFVESQGNL